MTRQGTLDTRELLSGDAKSGTPRQDVARWSFAPLRKMGHDDGFTFMMVLLALSERRFRVAHGYRAGGFGDGHPLLGELACDLDVPDDVATAVWRWLRNGLVHCGLPKHHEQFAFEFTPDQAVAVAIDHRREHPIIRVHPIEQRELRLPILEQDEAMWDRNTVAPLHHVHELLR